MMNVPKCKNEKCVFKVEQGMTTCVYYQPRYDANGVNLNPDRNITAYFATCETCNRNFIGSSIACENSIVWEEKDENNRLP